MDNNFQNQQQQYGQQPYGSQYTQQQPNYYQSNMPNKNKKTKKVIILAIIIACLLCCCGVGTIIKLIFGAIKPKEPIEMRDFILAMQDLHYENYSNTEDYYNEYHDEDYSTNIVINVLSTDELAVSNVETYKDMCGYDTANSKSSVSGPNYVIYRWRKDSVYYYTSRIDSTAIRIESNKKGNIDDILDKLDL